MKTTHTATVVNGERKLSEQRPETVSITPATDAVRRKEILKKFFESSDATPLFVEPLTREQLHERG